MPVKNLILTQFSSSTRVRFELLKRPVPGTRSRSVLRLRLPNDAVFETGTVAVVLDVVVAAEVGTVAEDVATKLDVDDGAKPAIA